MEMQLSLATSLDEIAFGFNSAFADLGFSSLIIGVLHVQFSCDLDRVDEFRDALGSPWKAFMAWLASGSAGSLVTA